MILIIENILYFIVFGLFLLAAYFFVRSISYDRAVKRNLNDKAGKLTKYILPSLLIPATFLNEDGIANKKKSILQLIYLSITLILALAVTYLGIEFLKLFE